MPYEPPPELAGLSLGEIAKLVEQRKLPPVEQWEPKELGDSHMRIAADGKWFHEGGLIRRPTMVRAFSTLLIRDEEGHWLVTPQQKLSIEVEDAAFIAVDVKREKWEGNDALAFRLNTDDLVIAGPDNPIALRGDSAAYLGVRHGTEARLNRSTWVQLAEIALAGDGKSVESRGARFPLAPA